MKFTVVIPMVLDGRSDLFVYRCTHAELLNYLLVQGMAEEDEGHILDFIECATPGDDVYVTIGREVRAMIFYAGVIR